jgi:hypothetical protein
VAEDEYDSASYQQQNEREKTTAESLESRHLVFLLTRSGHPVSDAACRCSEGLNMV